MQHNHPSSNLITVVPIVNPFKMIISIQLHKVNQVKSQVLCAMIIGASSLSSLAFANDKVEKVYDAQLFQKVCKGKSAGDAVTFAHRGIIWNGTCEQQFFSSTKSTFVGTEAEIYNTCQGSTGTTTATINGQEIKGKCALGFTPPRPHS